MKVFFTAILLFVIALVSYFGFSYFIKGEIFNLDNTIFFKPKISISSSEFINGQKIPSRFTCDGDDINPPLIFDRVPPEAKSLVVILEDVSVNPKFTHWIIFNIDPQTTSISDLSLLAGGLFGTNDFGKFGYNGPCPTEGSLHKYYFKVYALDSVLDTPEGIGRSDLEKSMEGHIIASGETYGTYSK